MQAQQTWVELQAYFTEKWLERKHYSATTAKQSRFKEAALLTHKTAAAKEGALLRAQSKQGSKIPRVDVHI
jgi:hypothetical protein